METVGVVYKTDDLSIFKTLGGNRKIKEPHRQELIESIDKNGYIMNPIIVNEKFEVIDGQTRLAACKELGFSIFYIMVPGLGINDCMILNASSKTWRLMDYILSYAEQGNDNYKRILRLASNGLGFRTYMFANNIFGGTGRTDTVIKEGHAICSNETFERADAALKFLLRVKPFTDRVIGRRTDLEVAVLYAYADENCDNDRLIDSISKYYSIMDNIVGEGAAMDEISKIYNRNLKGKKRLYLREDYDRFKHD